MRIGFDAKRFFHNFTGLGNYSRFVIQALAQAYPENELFLFTPKLRHHPEVDSILANPNIHTVAPGFPFKLPMMKSLWRSWGMSSHASMKALHVYHGLSQELPIGLPSSVTRVVTVHDLIFLRFPELYKSIDVKIYHKKVKSACARADKIVAISQQTADDIVDFLSIPKSKIEVVYQGAHPIFTKTASAEEILTAKNRHRLPEHYVLNVGTIEPRKNALLLIEALSQMPANGRLPLVIMGRPTAYKEKLDEAIQRYNLQSLVLFRHDVPFADFPAIYQGASTFLYPSRFEGFGIPIVEAMESRVPVITSTGSCFSEAGGPGAVYVSPDRSDLLADAVLKILSDEKRKREMIQRSTEYVKRFRPGVIAADMMNVYRALPS